MICFIISTVTFIRWFRRAYYNLSLKDNYLSHSNKDVAICWFLPFVNLYKPYQIMKEMYRKTGYLLEDHVPEAKGKLSLSLVMIWWMVWIINNVLGSISLRLSENIDTIEELFTITYLSMVINLISILLALLAIQVVKRYAQTEPLLSQVPNQDSNFESDINP